MRLRQLFEGTARRIVAVMPGGFHPFHPGHKSLYDWAVQTFGKDNVYVAATDDTAVRPFPFEVKKQLAAMAGVPKDRFIQVKSPFNAMSYNNLLEPDTAIVFVRSVKDKTEQPLPDQTKKNGEPGYLKTYTGKNLDTANQSGYMAYGPTINFDFSGMKFKSAGELRNTWPAMSPEDKLKAAKLLYGNGAPVAVELLDKALGGAVEEGTADDIIGKAGTLAGAAGAAVISSAGAASRLAWQGLKYVIAGILNIHPEDVAFVRQQLSKQGKAALYNLAKDGGRVEPTLQKTLELTPRMRMDAIKKLIGDIEAKAAAKAAAATVSRTTGAGRGAGGRIFSINDNPIQSGQNALGQKWLEMSNESNPFTDARMNAIKAGKSTFTVGGKTYKVTGDTSDEENAVSEKAPPGREKQVKSLKKKFDDPGAPYAIAWAQHNKKKKKTNEYDEDQHPNFDFEWDEAERYPEFAKIGKAAWIELAKTGKAVTIKSAKGINNTDAADPDSFKSLDAVKQGRALDQLKSGTVEMPIIAVYSDGWKELIGGNTRLTAMLAQDGKATVWVFKVPDEVAELAENFADGKKPGRKGLAKRSGVNTKASVSSLRKTAKSSSGEKQRMAHWQANMKAGKANKK